jgi:hypothetical protein
MSLEMFRSVISTAQGAIKSSFLLNGGATIALLAFIGHLAQFKPEKVAIFSGCLLPFTYGALAVAVTSGFAYLAQWFYAEDGKRQQITGFVFNILCVVLCLASYACFVVGLFQTHSVLSKFTQ